VHRGFNDQLSKWTARLPFSSLRAELLLLRLLAPLRAHGLILYSTTNSTIEPRQHAAEATREGARWLIHHLTVQQRQNVAPRSE
jgi:hypothetical protein